MDERQADCVLQEARVLSEARVLREARPGSSERVLVAVMNNLRDWQIVREQAWYRIPVKRTPRRIGADYLAFYFTGAFPEGQRHHVVYYAPIRAYRLATRAELLPDEASHPRAQDRYFKIEIGPLERLPRPIPSRKLRRVTFISTSLYLLLNADEINDLWEKERRQDELWAMLRTHQIEAEREVWIREAGTGSSRPAVGAGLSRPKAGSSRPAVGAGSSRPAVGAASSRPAVGAGLSRPCYLADLLIRCPGGPVIVICDVRQRIAGENVLYLTDDDLSDPYGCVVRIQRMMAELADRL